MIFFGWGGKHVERAVSDTQRVLMTYRYAHLFFILTVAWGRTFIYAHWTEQGWVSYPISEQDAAALCDGEAPQIPWWWRFSLLGVVTLSSLVGVTAAVIDAAYA